MTDDPINPPPPPPPVPVPLPPAPIQAPIPTTSGLAISSLICGILSIIGCLFVTGIPAIITGHMAVSKIKKDPTIGGKGLAIAGLVMGYISILLTLGMVGLLMLGVKEAEPFLYQEF